MSKNLRRLNNIYLDIRIVLDTITRNPNVELDAVKRQLKAALISLPAFTEQVDDIRSLNALYQFAKHVLEEIKVDIKIEKER